MSAAYLGVSPTLFDEMIRDGRAPRPKLVNSRTVWDRLALDAAFDALPEKGAINPWDASYA
jgi:predicted DNA-binding transcriptional regulator AlpA